MEKTVAVFKYLKFGVACILFFIGVKLMIQHWFEIPSSISLLIILAVFVVSIILSILSAQSLTAEAPLTIVFGENEKAGVANHP